MGLLNSKGCALSSACPSLHSWTSPWTLSRLDPWGGKAQWMEGSGETAQFYPASICPSSDTSRSPLSPSLCSGISSADLPPWQLPPTSQGFSQNLLMPQPGRQPWCLFSHECACQMHLRFTSLCSGSCVRVCCLPLPA